ncbi:hypothetical protein BRADI_4g33532v3 [Brachypodium distachyon]|uniref:HECT-type E3 ubiquitin transferase n=1 Tax=Brachypodium distachyon TaxID=15368 RepID=A0A2K2CS22_BRADI|nr:hypothetical protein BRADI_4g33532v3 [Brachypodium distachyon]
MTIHPATSSSDGGGSSSSFDAPQCSAHFFVRATDSKTIAVHAAWDDTVGALLAHLADCGYGRDLRLLYKGRQLLPEATSASLCLPPDSTLHLAARLRSTPHPEAWQLASHIAATAAAATPTPTPSHSLDGLVKEYILLASFTRRRSDRSAPVDTQSTEHCAAEYLDIFLQAGAAVALVNLYLSNSSFFRSFAERAIRCFLSTNPVSRLPPGVKPVTAPIPHGRLLSITSDHLDRPSHQLEPGTRQHCFSTPAHVKQLYDCICPGLLPCPVLIAHLAAITASSIRNLGQDLLGSTPTPSQAPLRHVLPRHRIRTPSALTLLRRCCRSSPSSVPTDIPVDPSDCCLTPAELATTATVLHLASCHPNTKKGSLYKSCCCTVASVLREPLSPFNSSKSPTRVIEQVLPFAREVVEVVRSGLASESMMVRRWMPYGPMHKNLYNMEHQHGDTWVWELHEMSMNLLRRVEECLKRLEMDLSTLSSESWRVIESQPLWSNRLHILAMLTELDSISALFEDLAHNLRVMLLAHKAPLNALVRCSKRNEHLHWLVKHKDLLCFEARRNLVLMLFSEGKDDYGELHEMLIDRSYFLDEFFEYITHAKLSVLHSGLFVEFKNEETTGPGVLREWLRMVCQALFSPQQVLFSPCRNDQRRFYWNGTSVVDPLQLKYFIFSGRVIGLALMHKVQVGIVLDRTLFLHLAGRSITIEDIDAADPVTYASCKRILEMRASDIDDLRSQRTIELCAGGQDIAVNIRNREHYIDLLIKNIFVDSISDQLANFAKGFSDILPSPDLQKVFLGGGSNNTSNLKGWRSHTQYNGYKEQDRHIDWFFISWYAIKQMKIHD